MTGADLWQEWAAAQTAMRPADHALLDRHGIPEALGWLLIGRANGRVEGVRFEPDAYGLEAYLTPILSHDPMRPETARPATAIRYGAIIDIVAWHPSHPSRWALRCGTSTWLGSIPPQFLNPPPVRVHRTILNWFRSGGRGLVPLTTEPWPLWQLLMTVGGDIAAEDNAHAAELRNALARPWHTPKVTVRA